MSIYNLKNYDYKNYKYSEKALEEIKKLNKVSKIIRLFSIISLLVFLVKYLKTDDFSYIILLFLFVAILRFIEYKFLNKSKIYLSKESLDDLHDFIYYFYCKKRTKGAHTMHLLDLVYCNFEKKNYENVLELLNYIETPNKLFESQLFLYYYYYTKSYNEINNKEKAKEYLISLNDLVKRKGLNKKSAKVRGVKIIIE